MKGENYYQILCLIVHRDMGGYLQNSINSEIFKRFYKLLFSTNLAIEFK